MYYYDPTGCFLLDHSTVNKCLKLDLNRFLTPKLTACCLFLEGGRPHLEDKYCGVKRKCTQQVSIHTSNPAHSSVSEPKMLQATKDQRSERQGEERFCVCCLRGRARTSLMCLLQPKSARVDERFVDSGRARVLTIMPHFKQRRQRGIHLGPPNFILISAIRVWNPALHSLRLPLQARKARIWLRPPPQHLTRLPAQFWYSCYGNCPQGRSSTDLRVGKGDVSFIIQMLIALRKARERFVCQIQLVFAWSSLTLNHSVAAL